MAPLSFFHLHTAGKSQFRHPFLFPQLGAFKRFPSPPQTHFGCSRCKSVYSSIPLFFHKRALSSKVREGRGGGKIISIFCVRGAFYEIQGRPVEKMQRKNVNPTDRSWSIQGQNLFSSSDGRDSFSPHLSASINAPTSDSLTFPIVSVSDFNFLFFFSLRAPIFVFFSIFFTVRRLRLTIYRQESHTQEKKCRSDTCFFFFGKRKCFVQFPIFFLCGAV